MGIVVTQAVDDLLRATPIGQAALRVTENEKITVKTKTDGRPAYFVEDQKAGSKTIFVNTSLPAQEVAFFFCHEAYHASQNLAGASGDATAQERAAFIETMVTEESVGTAIAYEFLEELKQSGRAITKPVPFRYDMYEDFVTRKRKALEKDHPDWAPAKLDATTKAFGRVYVRFMINDGYLRPSAYFLYSETYAREWQRARRPK